MDMHRRARILANPRRPALGRAAWGMLLALLAGCGPSAEIVELNKKGLSAYDRQDYVEAMACFKHAAELDRERPEAQLYMGYCYLAIAERKFREDDRPGALRECDRAIATFDGAIGAFPGYSRAVQAKADAAKLRGKHAAAIEVADWAARNAGPQSNMHILKGREHAKMGDLDLAELSFKKATAIEPDNAAAHAELGLFYMRCGNAAAAEKALRRANELDPTAPGVLAALAQVGAGPGRPPTDP